MASDFYQILGVDKSATEADIKHAFRKKAREVHPDVNKAADAEEQFKQLNEAYDVLTDPQKRAQYDQFGTVGNAGFGGGGYGSAGGFNVDFSDIFGGGGGFSVSDIFSEFFGGGSRRAGSVRQSGRDMQLGVRISLEDAARGIKKDLAYDRLATCDVCDGTGLAQGGKFVDCVNCGGSGNITAIQNTILGQMQTRQVCPECGGTGKTIDNPCSECDGQGRVPDREKVSLEIPAGIADGGVLRMANLGEAGLHGAASGNLLIRVQIAEDERFQRDGNNLHNLVKISITQAALGATIRTDDVLDAEGVTITIPPGTQNEAVIKTKDHGMPIYGRGSRGDLFSHLLVEIPDKLSSEQSDLLQQLAASFGETSTGTGKKKLFKK